MKYCFSYCDPQRHLIDIEFIADKINSDETLLQLPAWRPGRYELGNFAKNIKEFYAFDEHNNSLSFHKTSKDSWRIQTKGIKELHVKYSYYAVDLNAGSTFVDSEQLYVNPVNCCVYIPDRMNESCTIELNISKNFQVACALSESEDQNEIEKTINKHKLFAANYHELADSPFIASASLKHNSFFVDEVNFHLWFQGECNPDWTKMLHTFNIFIKEQFATMKGPTPTNEYHFLFQVLPFRFHHGVEHLGSTVIALGPSYDIMSGDSFFDLLSVSSHELFHAWNIKSIRPAEMLPYDYSRENYSKLGFVCEGVTTYYGDFFLFRSGIYSESDYLKSLSKHLQAHLDNFGRFNLSVADSSFDTWLDGYTEIVPHRKTSIYSEGCLLALMTDLLIRKYTNNTRSLDDVMCHLNNEFAKKKRGYTELDYKAVVEKIANHSFDDLFNHYIYKANSYENALIECIEYVGLELLNKKSEKFHERYYGIKVSDTLGSTKVIAIYPGSIAEKAGIQLADEIQSINNFSIKNNFGEWSRYFGNREISLSVINSGKNRTIKLTPKEAEFYKIYYLQKTAAPTELQNKNFALWSRRKIKELNN